MTAKLNNNSLIHAIQTVAAMSRMLEEYLFTPDASDHEKEALGELIADMDTTLDNLTTVYEAQKLENQGMPSTDDLMQAYSQYTLQRKV